ncbi:SAM-dependent methyltransferase, partial [Candidatus Woesearchaeota archaeon CG_4_10_14_0_8_um_filter_47_5]
MKEINLLYKARFTTAELKEKEMVWRILTTHFFQRYIKKTDTVLDLGAGYCEFINNITCKKKIAVDFNPDVRHFAKKDVEIIIGESHNLSAIASESVDVVFVSNVFEHMPNTQAIEDT